MPALPQIYVFETLVNLIEFAERHCMKDTASALIEAMEKISPTLLPKCDQVAEISSTKEFHMEGSQKRTEKVVAFRSTSNKTE